MSIQFKDEVHKENNFQLIVKDLYNLQRKYEAHEIKYYQLQDLRERTFEKMGWSKADFYKELDKRATSNKKTG